MHFWEYSTNPTKACLKSISGMPFRTSVTFFWMIWISSKRLSFNCNFNFGIRYNQPGPNTANRVCDEGLWHFFGQKLVNQCCVVGWCIIMLKKPISRRAQITTNAVNFFDETIQNIFIKVSINCLPSWDKSNFLWMIPRESKKATNMVLMRDFSKRGFFALGDWEPTQVALWCLLSKW